MFIGDEPVSPFLLKIAVLCVLHRLIEQTGGFADMERHIPQLHDSVAMQRGRQSCGVPFWISSPGFPESWSSSG